MYFTTLKVKNSTPIALKSHIEKFLWQFKAANQTLPHLDLEQLQHFILERSEANRVYRLNLKVDDSNSIYYELNPYEEANSPCSLRFFSKPFYEKESQFKKLAFDERLKLLNQAHQNKVDDWIFFDEDQNLLETTIANLFWIEKRTLYAPNPSLPYYQGVTMQFILQAALKLGYSLSFVKERPLALLQEKLVFICNSMKGIVQVNQIEGSSILTDNEIFYELQSSYEDLVNLEDALLPKR